MNRQDKRNLCIETKSTPSSLRKIAIPSSSEIFCTRNSWFALRRSFKSSMVLSFKTTMPLMEQRRLRYNIAINFSVLYDSSQISSFEISFRNSISSVIISFRKKFFLLISVFISVIRFMIIITPECITVCIVNDCN